MLLCIEIVVLCGYKKQFDSINLWGKFVDGVDSFDWSGKKKKSVEEDDNVTATMVMNVLFVLMMERKHFN
jgi:hypothetical protein